MNDVFKALADPTRRRVLELLRNGPMNAGELSEQFSFAKPTMSAHFAVLKAANLVETRRDGKQVIYQLKLSVLEDVLLGFAKAFRVGADNKAIPTTTAGKKEMES